MNKETGIHTFSLNMKSSYSEIQNIITENEHFVQVMMHFICKTVIKS